MVMTKEQATSNLLLLIDTCIRQGGIFNNAATVANMVNSVHVLGADNEKGPVPAMFRQRGSAAEQLQERIDKTEKQKDNGN